MLLPTLDTEPPALWLLFEDDWLCPCFCPCVWLDVLLPPVAVALPPVAVLVLVLPLVLVLLFVLVLVFVEADGVDVGKV
jgi:hypothetical protein